MCFQKAQSCDSAILCSPLLHDVLDLLIAVREPLPLLDVAKIIPVVEELPYDVFRRTGLKLLQMLGDDLGVICIPDLPGGSCGAGPADVADPLSHS